MKILEVLVLGFLIFCWAVVIFILMQFEKSFTWTGIVGLVLFLLLFFNANYFIVSKLQKFVDSDWGVFKTKIKWANGWAIFLFLFLLALVFSLKENG